MVEPAQNDKDACRIGVLALQGSFREHLASLRRLPGLVAVEVRTKQQLGSVDGLIIPGGESTTMALVAEKFGLISELRSFCAAGKPVWGTCAGMIFLADRATGMKQGGQALLGGLDCLVQRNFFGAQLASFETLLPCPAVFNGGRGNGSTHNDESYRALFIRAPGILECGPGVEVLSEYRLTETEAAEAGGVKSVAVAVRSRQLMATSFHPELTEDSRWHQVFVDMVRSQPNSHGSRVDCEPQHIPISSYQPRDIPVYKTDLFAAW